ncbi:MAG TPA: xanthine dehydrogenase family protein subunit M [Acidimicrobiales bacterium]|nr:xanthine dehydrogenase family protein subunit M [Acidimicrobiales bacterium]
MIPVAFEYERATTADQALALLAEHGDEAKLIAGGHSLLPLMKLRLATPAVLVDIARLAHLRYIPGDGDEVGIGALTRHCDLETSEVLAAEVPLLAHAAGQVGDPQVRHRGTLGGSIVHGDPASDLPAVLLALGGTVVVTGPSGERRIPAADVFVGFLETAVGEDELLTEVRVPRVPGVGWSFQKFTQRAGDWAIVGVAALAGGASAPVGPGVALVNMGATPLRATAVEAALLGGADAAEAASLAAEGTEAPADLHASPDFREHLARVLVRRALQEAAAR